MPVQPDSFQFSGVDMLDAYGIRCIAYDLIKPKLRPRKTTVPGRDGSYDFGAKYHEDRLLRLDCDSMSALTRHQLRELTSLLDKKGRIVLWDEPDKYYYGRIYDAAQLRYIGRIGHEFQLTFICDPFAYGEVVSGPMPEKFAYQGTATTPTRLEFTNTGTTTLQAIQIQIRERSSD